MAKKIANHKSYKRLIPKIHKQQQKNLIFKMGRKSEWTFFPKSIYKWPIGTRKDAH